MCRRANWPSTVTVCAPTSAELKLAVSPATWGTTPPVQLPVAFQLKGPGVAVGIQLAVVLLVTAPPTIRSMNPGSAVVLRV